MKTKNTAIGLATIVLVLAGGLPLTAAADKVVNMDLRFAGAFATGIMHVNPMTGELVPTALIHATAVGSPGRAEVRGFGGVDNFVGFEPNCFGSPGLRIDILENPLVFTFQDLSLLFAKLGNGQICIDLVTGDATFVINLMFDGGRGRFEGATGFAIITGEAESVSSDETFLGETGTIVGTIVLP
jgi:hypothetical protein